MNFGTPVPLLLGIFLILGALALFFLDKLKPGYSRDYDKVYALLFLLSGIFLIGHLTMELLPSFQQLMMVGMLTALTIQNIQARTPISPSDRYPQQGGPNMPGGRDSYRSERPGRSSYGMGSRASVQAELDRRDISPDRRYARPMLSGYEEQPRRRSSYDQNAYSQDPYKPDPYRQDSYGQDPYNQDSYNQDSYNQDSYKEDQEDPYKTDTYGQDSYKRDPYHGQDDYPAQFPEGDPGQDPYDRSGSSSYYSSSSRSGSDIRLRRRRTPKTRGEFNERYRLNPGDSGR